MADYYGKRDDDDGRWWPWGRFEDESKELWNPNDLLPAARARCRFVRSPDL